MGICCMTQETQPALCNNLEGWDGRKVARKFKRKGTCVFLRLIYVDVWQKPTQFCKAISLQLNKFKIKKQFTLFWDRYSHVSCRPEAM